MKLGEKGVSIVQKAAIARGEQEKVANVEVGTQVHKRCRERFTNQKSIQLDNCKRKNTESSSTQNVKRTKPEVAGGSTTKVSAYFVGKVSILIILASQPAA